jgi:hypothetical protein
MSVLRSIESKIAGLVEGTFSRAFRSEVRPVEIARKLAREMEEHRTCLVTASGSSTMRMPWSRSSPATCSSTRGGSGSS